jgi:pyruvate dehydrogenase E1 component
MNYGFNYLQDENGGSVYLRLTTRSIEQPLREINHELKQNVIKGGYWLRKPGPNPEIIIIYQGVVASEAVEATALLGERFKDIGVLAITSSDNLFHDWKNKYLSNEKNNKNSHIENLLKIIPKDTKIVTVIDGHPMTLSWIGSVFGHKIIPLGVDKFGQTGSLNQLFSEFAIDSESICNLGFNTN